MKTKLIAGALAAACMAPPALADHASDEAAYCHSSSWSRTRFLRDEILEVGKTCTIGQPLKLARLTRTYPAMGNQAFTVDYWQGSYVRTDVGRKIYEVDQYDLCGDLLGTSESESEIQPIVISFDVDNPNLRSDIDRSFELVPMTDDEASAALDAARAHCQGS
jgi:hypothetical protein